jgi:hypothetical protein
MSNSPDRAYVYRHIWPIVDEDRPLSSLRVEASAALGPILGRLGVRPTAQPRYLVSDDRLVCEVPVLRLDGDEPDPRTEELGGPAEAQRVNRLRPQQQRAGAGVA